MKKLLISIIVPVWNIEKYIKKSLDSLINQTYKELEIIVINDGSTDNTQFVLEQYALKDKRIKVINQENTGQGLARNAGIKKATGDYILFVDGDDWVELTMVEEVLGFSLKGKLDITVFNSTVYYKDGQVPSASLYNNVGDIVNNYIISSAGPVCRLVKSEIIKDNNFSFPNIRFYEDIAVMSSLGIYTNNIGYLEKSYYNYYIRDNSTMNQLEYNVNMKDIFKAMDILSNLLTDKVDELEFLYIRRLLLEASLRYLNFDKKMIKEDLKKIRRIMREKYPSWKKNKYMYLLSKKERFLCSLFYKGMPGLYLFYKKVGW